MADMASDIAEITMNLYKHMFDIFFAGFREFGHIAKALAKGTWNTGKGIFRWSRDKAAPAIKQHLNKDQKLIEFNSIQDAVIDYEALRKTEKFKDKHIELIGKCLIVNKKKYNKIEEAQLHKLRYEVTQDKEGIKKKVKHYEDAFKRFNNLMEKSQTTADDLLERDDPNHGDPTHDKSLKNSKVKDDNLVRRKFDSVYEAVKYKEELLAKTHVNTNELIFKPDEVKMQGTTVIFPKREVKVAIKQKIEQKVPEFDPKDKWKNVERIAGSKNKKNSEMDRVRRNEKRIAGTGMSRNKNIKPSIKKMPKGKVK